MFHRLVCALADIASTGYIYAFELALLATSPKPLSPIFNFVKPFSLSTWLSLGLVLALTTVAFVIQDVTMTKCSKSRWRVIPFEVFGSFLSQSKHSLVLCHYLTFGHVRFNHCPLSLLFLQPYPHFIPPSLHLLHGQLL